MTLSKNPFSKVRTPMQTLIGVFLFGAAAQASLPDFSSAYLLGGETTFVSQTPTVQAYKMPAQNMSEADVERHAAGDLLFEQNFSDDPQRPEYGLGPVFNNQSCAACHALDGRGSLPVLGHGDVWKQLNQNEAIFLRMSLEDNSPKTYNAQDNWGAPRAVPGFGTQLFHLGSFLLRPDLPSVGQAQVFIKLDWQKFTYPDGTTVDLRKPVFKVLNPYDQSTKVLADGTVSAQSRLFQPDVRFGARMTPGMIGLGLLEAVKEEDILALANRDLSAWGIHGHPNWVLDRQKELNNELYPISLGRFGLKANTPTVYHQALGALHGDLGVTNPAFPEESILGTSLFDSFLPHWKPGVEATQETSESIVFYSQTLAVPSRRNVDDPFVQKGSQVFEQVGCTTCHQPSFTTGDHAIKALAGQKIYPFTDFLLHDMGDGLADGRSDFRATGNEWRTRPLWGIGLAQVVNPRAGFLHDGRARTLEEAILWHDGESRKSKRLFTELPKDDREALIEFLRSL